MRLTEQVNSYLAILIITIIGAGAAFLIMHIATADTSKAALGNEAPYQDLQKSILGQ